MSWLPTTVVWDSLESRLPVDWCRALLRGARWPELSVDESVRVSLEMDGSRPVEGTLELLLRSNGLGGEVEGRGGDLACSQCART